MGYVLAPLGLAGGVMSDIGTLTNLLRWMGDDMKVASVPADTIEVIGALFSELRYEHLVAFEFGAAPERHPLEVRTRNDNVIIRVRSRYISGPSQSD